VATDVAVLDACVLYPVQLRDFFLSLAAADLFRPKWSDAIHEEWISALLASRSDLTRKHLEAIRDLMNQYFLDSEVQGFETLIPTLTLPDPDDRHVLAAAIHSRADAIVTVNLKDFPPVALAKMRSRLRAPAITPTEFVDSIERAGLPAAAARLRHRTTRL